MYIYIHTYMCIYIYIYISPDRGEIKCCVCLIRGFCESIAGELLVEPP